MNNIFFTQPLPNNDGYTWSIVSRLGNIISQAELFYGERDKSFTILGIEVVNSKQPKIWFPGSRKDIIIQITQNCIGDMGQAVFQVAHEVIHCLCPKTMKDECTILEEGLATYFSKIYSDSCGYNLYPTMNNYKSAMTYVEQLLSYDKDIILKARNNYEQDLSKIHSDILLEICPNIDKALVDILTKPFSSL